MGAGHSHSHRAGDDFEVPRVRRLVLLWVLGLTAVATVVGVALLWPDGGEVDDLQDSVSFAAPGVTYPQATVDEAEPACPDLEPADDCGAVQVTLAEGDDKGTEVRVPVPPQVSESGLQQGDTIRLISTPETAETPQAYNYFGTGRSGTLWLLTILFVAVVLLVARLRGLFALVGLGFTAVVAWTFMLPALLVGEPPLAGRPGRVLGDHVRRPLHDPRPRRSGPALPWPAPCWASR